jgi:hypothetical protein
MVTGDIVEVVVERAVRNGPASVTFFINGTCQSVGGAPAYTDLPTNLVPCVDLGNRNDSITLLTGRATLFDDDG